MNTTHTTIESQINELKTNTNAETVTLLHDQFVHASTAGWTRAELAQHIKGDNDVLDACNVEEGGALWADIREIQDFIINFFGEDETEQ